MASLIIWLLEPATVPTGALVWAGGGVLTAVILALLLIVLLAVMVAQRDRSEVVQLDAGASWPARHGARLPHAA